MATLTVTDLMLNFAAACRAVVPALDRVEVPWRDGEQYDNWDRVAEALFESLVTEPCLFQAVGEVGSAKLRIARYGFENETACNAWVAAQAEPRARVITLSSLIAPFDHVRCAKPVNTVPLHEAQFVFVFDAGDGLRLLDRVDLAAY